MVPCSVSIWYEDYITRAKTKKIAVYFDQGKNGLRLIITLPQQSNHVDDQAWLDTFDLV